MKAIHAIISNNRAGKQQKFLDYLRLYKEIMNYSLAEAYTKGFSHNFE